MKAKRILVVGVCTAGKSTLVRALRERGHQAYSVAQEHSSVPGLWRLRKPDHVVYLDVNYDAAKRRRRIFWDDDRLRLQRERLRDVRTHAHLVIDTSHLTCEQVLDMVLSTLT